MNHSSIQMAITIAVVAVIFALRFRGMTRERPFKLELIWIMPALLVAAMVAVLLQFPPHGLDWAWLAAIFAVGAAIGWWRGKLMPIAIDPETHVLNIKPSPAAILFLLGLFVVRFALRALIESEASAWHVSASLITDGFIVLGVGLLAVSRVEMGLRAWGLLREARAAKAAA
ncbi:CcdC protein domain-containing protein [Caulobacter sp. UNC358MFTsu5.1]|uniref:CcdC protein domain-containing protein n=1 Tax=Caulobacter sp. UNC358MFTsu5.1 TaxID=1449049 RepID=UPI0004A6D9AB|nr:CcdC protein domain-containing protein [Caulobacter sp. UNC358MFTsu5.1]